MGSSHVSSPLIATPEAQRRALWIALALVFVWGTNFTVQKLIFPVLTPPGFLFGRFLIMPVCAAVWMCVRYGIDWPPVDRPDLWLLMKLAVAGHVLHVGLVTYGIHFSTAFSSALILACGPLFTLLILRLTGVERLKRAQVAGVVVACAGVVVFLSDKFLGEAWRAGSGDLILLVAATAVHQAWILSFELGGLSSLPYLLGRVGLAAVATGPLGTVILSLVRRVSGRPLFGDVSFATDSAR